MSTTLSGLNGSNSAVIENVETHDAVENVEEVLDTGAQSLSEEDKKECGKKANDLVTKAVREITKGERTACKANLTAGLLLSESLRYWVASGASRSNAVKIIQTKIFEACYETLSNNEINLLMRAGNAFRLIRERLGESVCTFDALSWGHWHHALALLVKEMDEGTQDEYCVLLPGFEAECVEAFRAAATAKVKPDRMALRTICQNIEREWVERTDRVAREEKERIAAEVKRKQDEAIQQKLELERIERERKDAERREKEAKDAAEREKTEEARREAERIEAQRIALEREKAAKDQAVSTSVAAASRAMEEERIAAKRVADAEREKKRVAEQDRKREDKRNGKGKGKDNTQPDEAPKLRPDAYANSEYKDVAEMLVAVIARHKTPAAVLLRVIELAAVGNYLGADLKAKLAEVVK